MLHAKSHGGASRRLRNAESASARPGLSSWKGAVATPAHPLPADPPPRELSVWLPSAHPPASPAHPPASLQARCNRARRAASAIVFVKLQAPPPLIPRKYMARQRTQTASAVATWPSQARAHRQPDRAACGATGASLRQSIAWLPGSGLRHFLPHHRPCVTLLRPVRLLVLPCAGLCRQARAALF